MSGENEPLRASSESKRTLLSAQGSLANILPVLEDGDGDQNAVLDEEKNGAVLLGRHASSLKEETALLEGRGRTASEMSFDLDSEIDMDDNIQVDYSAMKDKSMRTPGDIRTAVLDWMYEEKDEETCPDLVLSNAPILEDLISVFVSVVLHGKSDVIRGQVWRFLIQCSVSSLHFAFLVICNLNASYHQRANTTEDSLSYDYRKKRLEDLSSIEQVIETIKSDSIPKVEKLGEEVAKDESKDGPVARDLHATLKRAVEQLESVHDNQVLTNLDLNVRGRTARQNIDLLVQKVRGALSRSGHSSGSMALKELDGRLGFIKTLTDLDEWMRTSVSREERSKILDEKLESLSGTLPLGAYFPTAVDRATQQHRVLRLVVEETIVFNTAQKCPFLLVAEVEPISTTVHEETINSNFEEPKRSPRKAAFEALEMVSKREFWKNPVGEIKRWKERSNSDFNANSLQELTELDSDDVPITAGENVVPAKNKKVQEKWEDMQERIRRSSPFGDRPRWQLASMFVKSGDDLRQQQLGVLFVSTFQKIFLEEGVNVWLSPYKVIATGPQAGLLEPARNSDSIARIKERGGYDGIDQFFSDKFGPKNSREYKRAQKNFMQSLAGYSIVAYLLKLHDRHNGNILVDTEGHLLHIDFGFMLGYYHKLERSPFKLTADMVTILDGSYSPTFQKFRRLMEKAFIAANKHHRELILLAELMSVDESSSECFAGGRRWVIDEFRDRFCVGLTTRKLKVHINDVIDASLGNFTTRCYDKYQRCVNGIW